jgi:hypothetical protein
MPIQPRTFNRLPPRETIERQIELHKQHLTDLTSYLWYIMPVADRVGDRAYDVAAESLRQSGLTVTAAELRELAAELKTPEGQARYAANRRFHLRTLTTYRET